MNGTNNQLLLNRPDENLAIQLDPDGDIYSLYNQILIERQAIAAEKKANPKVPAIAARLGFSHLSKLPEHATISVDTMIENTSSMTEIIQPGKPLEDALREATPTQELDIQKLFSPINGPRFEEVPRWGAAALKAEAITPEAEIVPKPGQAIGSTPVPAGDKLQQPLLPLETLAVQSAQLAGARKAFVGARAK